ncbi:MAG: YggU family protein [Deltaproteobacteria bacterium]|nr:MAG: YggU family protein [Deltaproteobacteria bacterium]
MDTTASFLKTDTKDVQLTLYVQPKASKNAVAGYYGDALKVRLTAPPVDGAANKMCIKLMAKLLSLPPSRLEIISGHTSRSKRMRILEPDTYPGGKTALIERICSLC